MQHNKSPPCATLTNLFVWFLYYMSSSKTACCCCKNIVDASPHNRSIYSHYPSFRNWIQKFVLCKPQHLLFPSRLTSNQCSCFRLYIVTTGSSTSYSSLMNRENILYGFRNKEHCLHTAMHPFTIQGKLQHCTLHGLYLMQQQNAICRMLIDWWRNFYPKILQNGNPILLSS